MSSMSSLILRVAFRPERSGYNALGFATRLTPAIFRNAGLNGPIQDGDNHFNIDRVGRRIQILRESLSAAGFRPRLHGQHAQSEVIARHQLHRRVLAPLRHTSRKWRAAGKLPDDSRLWKKGGEKRMSAYEYYDHDNLMAGGRT